MVGKLRNLGAGVEASIMITLKSRLNQCADANRGMESSGMIATEVEHAGPGLVPTWQLSCEFHFRR